MPDRPLLLSRRAILLGSAGFACRAAIVEFWEKKPPAEWTTEEIDRLITKSPWAKEVNAEYAAREHGGGPVGIGIPGVGGGRRGRNGNGGRGGAASSYKGIVRWESAKPILEAMKSPLPDQFEGHYVISVNGLPLLGVKDSGDDSESLKELSTLQAKGKDLLQAGVFHKQVSSGNSFLLGFSKEILPISASDGEVTFATRLGQLSVKARFVLKEMMYHGDLAV